MEAKIWTDDTYWGLIYRADNTGTTYYDAYLNTKEGKIEIWKHTNGIWGRSMLVKQTPVGGPAIQANTWYRMRLVVNGNNIKVFFALDGEPIRLLLKQSIQTRLHRTLRVELVYFSMISLVQTHMLVALTM